MPPPFFHLGGTTGIMEKRVYLSAIRLTNCQSFKDSVIEFATDRLNVFVADNSTGKSVFFRMLSITAFPGKCSKEDRLNIIRRGSQFAQILYMFSDGSYGGVRVFPDRMIYYYTPDKTTQMTPSTEPSHEFISKLGLILDNNSGFVANLIDMDQNLLLVNSNQKSDSNILQMLTGNETLDRMIESTAEKKKTFDQYEDRLKDVVHSYNKSIDGYNYVDTNALENSIEQCERIFDTLYKLAPISDDIAALASNTKQTLDYDRLLGITTSLIRLEQLKTAIESLHVPKEFNEKALENTCTCIKVERLLAAITGLHVPREQKDRNNYLHTLLVLEGIKEKLATCKYNEPKVDLSPMADTLQRLEQLRDATADAMEHNSARFSAQQVLAELYNALSESGEIISCGLYGEVAFNGKKCIPIDK